MAEYQIVVDGFLNNPLTGRRPIETPETEINLANVLKVVMGKAEPIHLLNKNEIRFLHNYYLGSQPVLHRTKEYHAEITNRIVEKAASALADGDMDKVFKFQSEFMSAHDTAYKASLLKDMPTPPSADGKGGSDSEGVAFAKSLAQQNANTSKASSDAMSAFH